MAQMSLSISHASVECRACDGMGFRSVGQEEITLRMRRIQEEENPMRRAELREELSAETTCTVCKGSGYTTQSRADRAAAMDSMWTTVRCGRCKGTGETFDPSDETAEIGDVCPACGTMRGPNPALSEANGFFVPVTVKEKGSSKHGKAPKREAGADPDADGSPVVAFSAWVDEDALVERGSVARGLDELRRVYPALAAAAESYFGPDGDKWGGHQWGRLFALWQHTEAGRKLAEESAERSRAKHGFLLTPLDLIAAEREAAARAADPGTSAGTGRWHARRRALIGRADGQARSLYGRMMAELRGGVAA